MQKNFTMIFTDELIEAATPEYLIELESKFRESILLFPEFRPKLVSFDLILKDIAFAQTTSFRSYPERMIFSINPTVEVIYYYFMGHELTHFAQELVQIPHYEQHCDLWTMARSELFTDISPSYIDMPMKLRDYWDDYKVEARKLFIKAIESGKTGRKDVELIERELFMKGREN